MYFFRGIFRVPSAGDSIAKPICMDMLIFPDII
jgi:hypothetical protein